MASPSQPDTLATLTAQEQADIDLLHGLVAIPSTSNNEADAVRYLVDQMAARGFDARIDRAGNAIGTVGSGGRQAILLGHIDTVPGDIPVRIEDGVLHGRGAVDAKGPLATFVAAATAAADRLDATVTVIGAVGEETMGSPGATEIATWPAPDLCLIGEPSGWDAVCLGYRGSAALTWTIERDGRHSAGPGESVGDTAHAFWAAVLADIAARNGEATGFAAIAPTLRGMASTSDGLRDTATLDIGLRLPAGIDVDDLLSTIGVLGSEGRIELHGVQRGYVTDKRSPITAPFLRAIRANGGTPRFTKKLGTSDMSIVGPVWGCPMVAYGPGDASLDHTPEERIVLDDYLCAVRVLTEVLVSL